MPVTSANPTSDRSAPLAVQVVRQYLPNRGGLEEVVANLAGQLLRQGYRVRVVTLDRRFTALDETLPSKEIINGVEVVRIPFSGSTRYPVAPQVFRHIGDADIVHVHAIDFFFDALAWAQLFHGRPMIATTHGGFFHTEKYAGLKTIWFNTATRLSALAYRRLIGCSAQDTRTFQAIAGSRVVQIDNGVDTRKFADSGSRQAVRHMVTLGRFSVNKRLDNLLDATRALVSRSGHWHLDIVGVPGDQSVADVERMIAERHLGDHVAMHIGLSNEEIRGVLGKCSLFASASDYEGFGLVAVEALSAALMPLLNTNTAYSDLASKHPEIRLSDFADSDATAMAIETAFDALAADTAGYRNAAMRTADGYSWDHVAERYLAVYREVLGARAPAAAMTVTSEAG
ncbi:glycosyltransferase family 4 protein [Mesorhizobium sp. NPDC059054]|uniref:glycosyltransferase family 4 protein n=1 Tax=Mesorhizobium sp. NPDC059054 TaxID=3346711 RepID=UPI00368F3630